MEDTTMDLRAKTVIASFLALFGVLAFAVWASLGHAEPNRALQGALFGQIE